jgi:hypothetical protein
MALAVIGTLTLSTAATAQDEEGTFTRVRAANPDIRRVIREAHDRSVTFRALVDEIQQSNAIVVMQFGLCAKGRIRSCLVSVEGDARRRHIRIILDMRPPDYRFMATIAHELHHALEIVREPDVIDGASALRLYRRIATGDCNRGLSETCETEAALGLEKQVLDELHRGTATIAARQP